MKTEKKNKHMTLDDRIEIRECLAKGMTFKAIGRRIGKAETTVSREVKQHAKTHRNGFVKTDSICPKLLKASLGTRLMIVPILAPKRFFAVL